MNLTMYYQLMFLPVALFQGKVSNSKHYPKRLSNLQLKNKYENFICMYLDRV